MKNGYLNLLSIDQGGKGVPYGGQGTPRADGGANHGFKNLKTSPEEVANVPELAAHPALKTLVEVMNAPGSGLFTVGCESGPVPDQGQGPRYTGYVEFALNSRSHITDASSYFPLFFHFDRFLHSNKYGGGVKFDWELMGAHFIDENLGGFTCTIYVNAPFVSSKDEARALWDNALEALTVYFRGAAQHPPDPLYDSPTASSGPP